MGWSYFFSKWIKTPAFENDDEKRWMEERGCWDWGVHWFWCLKGEYKDATKNPAEETLAVLKDIAKSLASIDHELNCKWTAESESEPKEPEIDRAPHL